MVNKTSYIFVYIRFFVSMTMTRITQTSIYPLLTLCLTIAGLDASVGFNLTACVFVMGLILCHQQYTSHVFHHFSSNDSDTSSRKIYHWLRSIESLEVCLFLRISMFLRMKLHIVYTHHMICFTTSYGILDTTFNLTSNNQTITPLPSTTIGPWTKWHSFGTPGCLWALKGGSWKTGGWHVAHHSLTYGWILHSNLVKS